MNILFCNEGFIVDGVASFNLYLSAALRRAGNNVAVIGRWGACSGFQKRHRQAGVKVIQCPSVTVTSPWLLRQAVRFDPDIVITDARRSFPFARRIRRRTGAGVVTIFHDPAIKTNKKGRDLGSLTDGSDAWVTPERSIFEALKTLKPHRALYCFERPLTSLIKPLPMPHKAPFRVLCFGRLSRWKSPGLWAVAEKALALKEKIPSLEISVAGGGWRRFKFERLARRANAVAGRKFVRIVGAKSDPERWIRCASVVCAGATSAAEAILYGRPVVAFSGFWHGRVTAENISRGIESHFGERSGCIPVKENLHLVGETLVDLYRNWQQGEIETEINYLRGVLHSEFNATAVTRQYQALFASLANQATFEHGVGGRLPDFATMALRP